MICHGDELIFFSVQGVSSEVTVLKITQYTCFPKILPVQNDALLQLQIHAGKKMKEVTAATMSSHHADPSARAALVVKGLEGSWGRKMLRTLHWEEQNLCVGASSAGGYVSSRFFNLYLNEQGGKLSCSMVQHPAL